MDKRRKIQFSALAVSYILVLASMSRATVRLEYLWLMIWVCSAVLLFMIAVEIFGTQPALQRSWRCFHELLRYYQDLADGVQRTTDGILGDVKALREAGLADLADQLQVLHDALEETEARVERIRIHAGRGRPRGRTAWPSDKIDREMRNLEYWLEQGGTVADFARRKGISQRTLWNYRQRWCKENTKN